MNEIMIRWIVIVAYFTVLLSFGLYQASKVKSSLDYNLSGRKLPGWVAALSERATAESAWCLIGFPGFAYAAGLVTLWTALGLFLGNVIAWCLIARRMRAEAERYDAQTYMDWISRRHGKSKVALWVRYMGGFIIVFMFSFYVKAQLVGGGTTFEMLFGMSPTIAILLLSAIVIPYAILGGFRSVTYTDIMQSVLMICALVITPIVGMVYLANAPVGTVFAHSVGDAIRMAGPEYGNAAAGFRGILGGFAIAGEFAWIIAYIGGLPHLATRFMSIRSDRDWRIGRNIACTWTFFGYAGAIMIGLVGLAMFGPANLENPEMVMPSVVLAVFPPVIAALIMAGVIAAVVSSADSMLIVTSTEFSENILKPYLRNKGKTLDAKKGLTVSRLVTVVAGIVAASLPFLIPGQLVHTIVSFAWAGIGNPFAVTACMTLFWSKFTGKAALWTMICGFSATVIWTLSPMNAMINARLVGVIPALIAAIVVTKLTWKTDACEARENEGTVTTAS